MRQAIKHYHPDIICLQEHWLFNFEQSELSSIHPQYDVMAKSVDDLDPISPIQRPRGYGGMCIMWKKDMPVTPMPDGSSCTQVVQVGNGITIINTYLPCQGKYSNEQFKDEVDQITEIIKKYQQSHIILAGDMNVDIHWLRYSMHTQKWNTPSHPQEEKATIYCW